MSTMSDAQYQSIVKNLHTANDPYVPAPRPPEDPNTAEECAYQRKRNAVLKETNEILQRTNDALLRRNEVLAADLKAVRAELDAQRLAGEVTNGLV
jgi:hypothetical protein